MDRNKDPKKHGHKPEWQRDDAGDQTLLLGLLALRCVGRVTHGCASQQSFRRSPYAGTRQVGHQAGGILQAR